MSPINLGEIPAAPQNNDELAATHPSLETLQLLATRRSTVARMLTEPGPNAEEVKTLLRLASRVPDHGKLAPWRFIVFEGNARQAFGDKLVEIFKKNEPSADHERQEFERQRFMRAPIVIALISRVQPHPKIPEWEQVLSAGAVGQIILIAASAMGYAVQWITEWLAYDDDVNKLLKLSEGERVAGIFYLGTAQGPITERARPMPGNLITHWSAS